MGTPKILKTDNGPPWNGSEITQFTDYLGFHHRKTTPYWSQANSEVEQIHEGDWQNAEGLMQQQEKLQPWRQALQHMLRIGSHPTQQQV